MKIGDRVRIRAAWREYPSQPGVIERLYGRGRNRTAVVKLNWKGVLAHVRVKYLQPWSPQRQKQWLTPEQSRGLYEDPR